MYQQYTVLEVILTGDSFRKKIVCKVLVGKPECKSGESCSLLNSVNDISTVFCTYFVCLDQIQYN